MSLVRFRTNIRDPKEITVLLISLAIGLASGVGRWDLAIVLTLFSLVVLWLFEWREPELVFRSMELKVTTKNVVSTQKALRQSLSNMGSIRSCARSIAKRRMNRRKYRLFSGCESDRQH